MKDLLTASRIAALQRCPRAHYLRYELCLKATTSSDALRFGSAWHRAMEARATGSNLQDALVAAIGDRSQVDELAVATLSGMLAGYWSQWGDAGWILRPEIEFLYALRAGRGAMWAAGKIDGIREMPECALIEYKTCGTDIGPDSAYWLRLRGNSQILQYVEGARRLGYDPRHVIYDVARKPAIRPKQTESIDAYADRLAADTQERPDFYFARREVPILEDDLARFREERRHLAAEIQWRRRHGAWPRAVSERTCLGCEYVSFCLQGITPTAEAVPAGFQVCPKHEELQEATKE